MTGINKHSRTSFNKYRDLFVCLFLIVATLTVYWQVRQHDFVNFDDGLYVTDNRHIQDGLTLESVLWAFTTIYGCNWHPLAWLSHMLDHELFGMNPGGHHLTSLFFHIVNTLLLFGVFKKMTGYSWRSGFVAALFALHPLHVESVAWITERKDVLSTFFWMLTIWAYIRYIEHLTIRRYLTVLLFFILGLMAKPMVITMPFVLLLLDYWPLGRLKIRTSNTENNYQTKSNFLGLVWEKTPFFILVGMSCVVTFYAQNLAGAVVSLDVIPFKARLANAMLAYVAYIGKMIWPSNLAAIYMYSNTFLWWKVALAGLSLAVLFSAVIMFIKKKPYLAVGWLWFTGTLVPVIGLVQVGSQSMADRYTYIPLVGLFIIVAWGFPELIARLSFKKVWLTPLAILTIVVLMVLTRQQVSYWKNSITLFKHALEVTSGNYRAHNSLAVALKNRGQIDEAVDHYLKAIRIKPDFEQAHNNLGFVLFRKGNTISAIDNYLEALRIRPDYAEAHSNLGVALIKEDRIDEAISHFLDALRIQPDAGIYNNLGFALLSKGDMQGAVKNYLEALRIQPDYADARYNLGIALEKKGRMDEAINHYRAALRTKPDFAEVHNNLGILLEKKGRVDEAISHYTAALRIRPDFAEVHNNLGIALFIKGNVKGALYHFKEALRIKPDYIAAKNNFSNALIKQKQ